MAPNVSPSRIRVAIRDFTTQWFLIAQGTGILAIILHNLAYQFRGLGIISTILWVLTIVELCVMVLIYGIRWFLYPTEAAQALKTQTAELSCLASPVITFTTILIMIVLTLPDTWGKEWGMVAYVMWWINALFALIVVTAIPYCYAALELQDISTFPPSTQLPIISTLTCAAGGGAICNFGELSPDLQVPVIIVSYLFVGCGLPLALTMDALSLSRILTGSAPTTIKINQHMILCGPWGQGSFALQILGSVVMKGSFAAYDQGTWITEAAAGPIGYASIFAGLLFWGQGTFWFVFAMGQITHVLVANRKEISGWGLPVWSLVFPMGVYTNACIQLGKLLGSRAFNVISTILAVVLVIIWLVNMGFTIQGILRGTLFGLESGWKVPQVGIHDAQEKDAGSVQSTGRLSQHAGGPDNGHTNDRTNGSADKQTNGLTNSH